MYTSILFAALSTVAPTADLAPVPSWSTDYASASKQQVADGAKPLVVVLGTGAKGYDKLDRDGKLGDEANALLAAKYVCVYVDTSSPTGKRLAKSFAMETGLGIIISDRTGDVQAYRHEGDLAATDLLRSLERYSDPERTIRTTEGDPTQRISNYAPPTEYSSPVSYPSPASYPGFGGSGFSPAMGCASGH